MFRGSIRPCLHPAFLTFNPTKGVYMLSTLSKWFGLGRRRQRPHRSGTVRTSRRWVPQFEMLETRVVLSPTICPERFSFPVGTDTYNIPYCRNDVRDEDVTRLIIAVHGIDRDADPTRNNVLDAARAAGADSTSLILAPQFLNGADLAGLRDNHIMFWNSDSPWRDGAQSSSTLAHYRPVSVSSFEVVDDLLRTWADLTKFPHLQTVIVSGHSAGGQFVQHYAASSQVENQLSAAPLNLSVRYVTMNPGSYLYLGPKRWDRDAGEFNIPTGPGTDGYNNYPYGLVFNSDLTALYPYVASLDTGTIHDQYGQRQVIYILGENDTSTAPPLDTSPPANLQGAYRFERGSIFFNYLQDDYGADILNHQVRETVPGVGHDSAAMYTSSPALKWLFDYNGSGGSGSGSSGNAGSELPNVGAGTDSFYLSSASQSLAGPLTVHGGGTDALVFSDTANPQAETYTFDAVPNQLTLTTVPVSVHFSGTASVYLKTNSFSTVNDPSGTVRGDVPPL
jgi:hypothetical protein